MSRRKPTLVELYGDDPELVHLSVKIPRSMMETLRGEQRRQRLPTLTSYVVMLLFQGLHGVDEDERLAGMVALQLRILATVESAAARVALLTSDLDAEEIDEVKRDIGQQTAGMVEVYRRQTGMRHAS